MKKYRVLRPINKIVGLKDAEFNNGIIEHKEFIKHGYDNTLIDDIIRLGYVEEIKEVSVDDLKKGGVYTVDFNCGRKEDQKIIFRFKITGADEGESKKPIYYYSALLCKFGGEYIQNDSMNGVYNEIYHIATPDEIDWLERCEKAGGFFEKNVLDDAMSHFKAVINKEKSIGFPYEVHKDWYFELMKENEELKRKLKNVLLCDSIIDTAQEVVKHYKKKKKGVNYYLNQLPLNIDGYTFNMNRYKDGYEISYWRCTKGNLINSHNKSFKKALKLMYKKLKKDGHIK